MSALKKLIKRGIYYLCREWVLRIDALEKAQVNSAAQTEALSAQIQALSAQIAAQAQALNALSAVLNDLLTAHHHTYEKVKQVAFRFDGPIAPLHLEQINHLPAVDLTKVRTDATRYAAFERIFYDSATVEVNQQVYLEHLPTQVQRTALDLGCGRGEFLKILAQQGWSGVGFDSNSAQCAIAANKGLHVKCEDLFTGLTQIEGNSVGLVSALQVVEHMPPDAIRTLIQKSFEVLVSGGRVIVETVNPLSPFALSHFWLDETHVRPVNAYWLEFCLSELGFTDIKTLYQSLVPMQWRSDSTLSNYANYAVIATKP